MSTDKNTDNPYSSLPDSNRNNISKLISTINGVKTRDDLSKVFSLLDNMKDVLLDESLSDDDRNLINNFIKDTENFRENPLTVSFSKESASSLITNDQDKIYFEEILKKLSEENPLVNSEFLSNLYESFIGDSNLSTDNITSKSIEDDNPNIDPYFSTINKIIGLKDNPISNMVPEFAEFLEKTETQLCVSMNEDDSTSLNQIDAEIENMWSLFKNIEKTKNDSNNIYKCLSASTQIRLSFNYLFVDTMPHILEVNLVYICGLPDILPKNINEKADRLQNSIRSFNNYKLSCCENISINTMSEEDVHIFKNIESKAISPLHDDPENCLINYKEFIPKLEFLEDQIDNCLEYFLDIHEQCQSTLDEIQKLSNQEKLEIINAIYDDGDTDKSIILESYEKEFNDYFINPLRAQKKTLTDYCQLLEDLTEKGFYIYQKTGRIFLSHISPE